MPTPTHPDLTRRESQIMAILYRRRRATVEDLRDELPDAPSPSSVRKLLDIMIERGLLGREYDGPRYVYFPAVKQGPMPCGAPVRIYGGFGIGAYRFDFRDQRAAVTRGGAHVMIGFEIRARERVAFAGDAALHAMRGPDRDPVESYSLAVIQWNVGLRYLF